MELQNNPYVFAVIVAGVISLVSAYAAYKRRKISGAESLVALMIALAIWMFAYALELAAAQLDAQIFFVKVKYIGIVTVPPLFIIFALRFAMPGRVTITRSLMLGIVPLLTLLLVWTNEWHGLIWYNTAPIFTGKFYTFKYESGLAFWAWAVYAYANMLAGSLVLVWRIFKTYAEHRTQAALLAIATLITWAGNIPYVSGNSPIPYLDTTPFTLVLVGLLLTWSIYRAGLFERIPIAGENILESLNEGIIVLDNHKRIVMANRTFEYYTKLDPASLVGIPVQEALQPWPEFLELALSDSVRRRELELKLEPHYSLFFDVRISPIRSQDGDVIGQAYILNDITERKQAERRLRTEEEIPDPSSEIIPLVFMYRQGDGKIIEANRTFIIKTGYNRSEVMGQSLLQLSLWSAETRADFIRALRDNNGKLDSYPLTLITHNGEPLHLSVSAHVAEVKGEKYVAVIGQPAST